MALSLGMQNVLGVKKSDLSIHNFALCTLDECIKEIINKYPE